MATAATNESGFKQSWTEVYLSTKHEHTAIIPPAPKVLSQEGVVAALGNRKSRKKSVRLNLSAF